MTLTRKTPIRRTGGLKRSKRMPRVNRERKARLREEQFGPQAEACRALPCAACTALRYDEWPESVKPDTGGFIRQQLVNERYGYARVWACSDPQHCPTRGAGGLDKDTLPLCRKHHIEAGAIGEKSFNAKYGIDQRAIARAIHEEMVRNGTKEG